MKKSLSLLFSCLISAYAIAQDLTASYKLPAEAKAGSSFVVEIKINKGKLNEFLKISNVLTPGFIAEELDCKGGAFTFNEEGVRIIWPKQPEQSSYTVTYKVIVPEDAADYCSITGKISYINGNDRKQYDLPDQKVKISKASVSAVASEKTVEPVKSVVTEVKEAPVKTNPVTATEKTPAPVSAVAVESGKTYRVQIGAYSAKPNIKSVPEITTIVLDNGITKYFSGNFAHYEEATVRKKMLQENGFPGAFIVSFQNGKIVK